MVGFVGVMLRFAGDSIEVPGVWSWFASA